MWNQRHVDLKHAHWTEKLVLEIYKDRILYELLCFACLLNYIVCELQILEAPSLSLPKKSTPKLPEFQVSASYLFPACCWSKIILGTNIMANQDLCTQFCKTSFLYHLRPDFCSSYCFSGISPKDVGEGYATHISSFIILA